MCGIVGFIGDNTERKLIEGLKKLEYRGYDSAGIAIHEKENIAVYKSKGEIKNLEKILHFDSKAKSGIGHTRWATHGKPDEINAHPHASNDKRWMVVHNGIIENYSKLKTKLLSLNYNFYSETDTETVANLLQYYSEKIKNDIKVLKETVSAIKGSYALGIINDKKSGIFFAKNKSPLFIAKNGKEVMLASDIICFKGFSDYYYELKDGIFGYADVDQISFYDNIGKTELKPTKLDLKEYSELNFYKHFMIKEIFDTKSAIKNVIEYYSSSKILECLKKINFNTIKKVKFVGCGTAYHACLIGAKMFEEKTDIEAEACVASEFRYSNPKVDKNTVVVLVSQSGETADTLAAFDLAKEKKCYTVSIVNVEYSTLAKKTDICLPIKAGVEIAVASTKAFSSQLIVLNIFASAVSFYLGNSQSPLKDAEELYNEFEYGDQNDFKLLADVFRYNDKLFMIGRGKDYFIASEASLKIKETSYINSDTYYAGELKHGFLALINEDTYVVVFATEKNVLSKTICNAEEVRARGAKVILFTCFDEFINSENFYYVIKVKEIDNSLQTVMNIVPWQIIAYYTSVNKGINPDKPRNLAKSVTVE